MRPVDRVSLIARIYWMIRLILFRQLCYVFGSNKIVLIFQPDLYLLYNKLF